MTDLILRGGRVIDPASGRDETADIAFGDGKVTEIGRDLPASGAESIDMRGLLVVPGLIDLHTHVYWGGTSRNRFAARSPARATIAGTASELRSVAVETGAAPTTAGKSDRSALTATPYRWPRPPASDPPPDRALV